MGVLKEERVDRIKKLLKWNPRGMTISDISSRTGMNRNLVSRYLDMLLISGQVEMSVIGAAKVYYLSYRVPISAMLEFSSDMVIVLDSGGKILMVNEPVLALLRQDRDAIVDTCIAGTTDPFLSALERYLPPPGTRKIIHPAVEFSCPMGDTKRHFRMKQVPMVFEDGGQGITLIIEDITDSVSYQENLMMSEARYRGIVEDQNEFIVQFLPDGTMTFANDAYARYLEIPREDLIGKPFLPFIIEEDTPARDQALSSLSRDFPVATFECRIRHLCGRDCWNTWTVRALFEDLGAVPEHQAVGSDTTKQHKDAAKINNYIRSMEFLAQTSMAFRNMGKEDDIFEYVAQQVYALTRGFLVWVGFLDVPNGRLVLKSVVGNPIAVDTTERLVGMKLKDMAFPIDVAQTAELIRHRKLVKAPPLYQLLHMQVPEVICRQIEEEARGIDSYLMGLVSRERIVGDIGISIPAGSRVPDKDLIEAFIRQAAIAIDKKIADDELRQSLAREQQQIRNLGFLSRTAMDFIDMDEYADIYRYIADRLLELVPESIIAVNSYDAERREITIRAIAGKRDATDKLFRILGINPIGMGLPIDLDPRAEADLLKKAMFDAPFSLHEIFLHQIPEERCRRAEGALGLGKAFGIGFTCRGAILGNVLIKLTRPGDIPDREMVVAFVRQASVALLRRIIRERERESEERFRLLFEENPYPLVILGREGRILAANRLAEALVGGGDPGGLSGKLFQEFLGGGGDMPAEMLRGLVSGERGEISSMVRLQSPGNAPLEVETRGRVIQYEGKPALFMTLYPRDGGGEARGSILSPR
jgi:PAS domain S-box-containing protein